MEGEEGAPRSARVQPPSAPRGLGENHYSPQVYQRDDGMVELGLGGAHYVPGGGYDAHRDERVRVAGIHAEIRRLMDDEKGLLEQVQGAAERADIREQFFHQRMNLISQLPEAERSQYSRKMVIQRFGTVRDNPDGAEEEVHTPWFIRLAILANVFTLIYSIYLNEWAFAKTSENPMYGPTAQILVDMGAKVGSLIRDEGEWWRWFAPMFLHAGIIHLLMNMMVLARLGTSMEESFGWLRVSIIYVASGVGGNLFSALMLPETIGVGASGSLFGLIGALFGDFFQNHRSIRKGKWAYFANLVFSSLIGLAIGLVPLIDNFAHIGGWVVGILTGTIMLVGTVRDDQGKRLFYWYTWPLLIFCLVLLAGIFVVGFSVFYNATDGNDWCSWCKNLTCVETEWWNCDDQVAGNGDSSGGT